MGYLLDSDIVIDFLKKQEPGFTFIKQLLENKLFMSIVSWCEILYGIKKSGNPNLRLKELNEFIKTFNISILPVDEIIGEMFIKLKINLESKKFPLADFDLIIAASVLAHNLELVTRNIKHFSRIENIKIYTTR